MYVTENVVFDDFNAKIVTYSDGDIHVEIFGTKLRKKNSDYEEVNKKNSLKNLIQTDFQKSEKPRSDNLVRTKKLIMNYAKQNASDFKSFITLTYKNPDETDLKKCSSDFNVWRTQISRCCKKNGFEFKYIGVYEKQKRGVYHFHLITNIPCNSEIIPKLEAKRLYNPNTHQRTKLEYYNIKYWKHGYSSAFDIKRGVDDQFKLDLYITKYITKDLVNCDLFGHKKVLKSNNLSYPKETYKLIAPGKEEDLIWNLKKDGYNIEYEKTANTGNVYCPTVRYIHFTKEIVPQLQNIAK